MPPLRERATGQKLRAQPRVISDEEVEEEQIPEEEDPAPGFLQVCWPAVFGFMLAVLAPRLHSYVVDNWGDVGERLVFPFMLLAGRPEFGLDEELRRNLPELIEYAAFPFFGLYMSWSMGRKTRFGMALAQVIFVNLIAAFVLWLLTKPGATHGM